MRHFQNWMLVNFKIQASIPKTVITTILFKRLLTFIYEMRIGKMERKRLLTYFNLMEPILNREHFYTSPINNNERKSDSINLKHQKQKQKLKKQISIRIIQFFSTTIWRPVPVYFYSFYVFIALWHIFFYLSRN